MPVPPARPGDCQGQEPGVLCFIFEAQNLLCASCMSGEWMNEKRTAVDLAMKDMTQTSVHHLESA